MAETRGEEEDGEIDDNKTDKLLDYYCEYCKEEDLDIEAGGYCVDCEEYLCYPCIEAHRRSRTRRHNELLDQDHMPRGSPLSPDHSSKYISTRCKVHSSKVVEYYCVSHNALVCTECFLKEHRSCDEIKVVLDESENIIDSHAHQDFVRHLRDLENRSTCMTAKLHDCNEIAIQRSENVKEQIRDATKEFHTMVDEAEQSLLTRMETLLSEDNSVNDVIEEIGDEIRVLIEETKEIVDSRRVCQLYIQMKEKNNEIVLLENKLKEAERRTCVKMITFEANDEVRNAFHAACLGQIRVKKGRGKSGSQQVTADHTLSPCPYPGHATQESVPMSPQAGQNKGSHGTSPQLFVEESRVTKRLSPNLTVHETPGTNDQLQVISNEDSAQIRAPESTRDQRTKRTNYHRNFLLQLQFATASMCIPEDLPDIPEIMHVQPTTDQEQVRILREITGRAATPYVLNNTMPTATTATQWRKKSPFTRGTPIEQRLAQFLNELATLSKRGFQETLVDAASNASLTITIVFNSDNQNHISHAMECDLFLEDIWITNSGTHCGKQDCVDDVYHNAWTKLLKGQANDVLAEKRRLSKQDLFGPFMTSVCRVGLGNAVYSNASTLTLYGHDLSIVANTRLEDIIIFERSEWSSDRQLHAIKIINLSCKLNGMLLQWETMSLLNTNATVNVRCQVFIQQQMIGDRDGVSKTQAKQLAFEEALFNLYEKQRVVQMNLQGDLKDWILYDVLQKEADEMKVRGMTPDLPVSDGTGTTISSFVVKAAYERIRSFVGKKAHELVFATGMPTDERNAICYIGRLFNLKCDIRSHDGQSYIAFFKRIVWAQMFDRLSAISGLYGKFFRVDKKDIPKFAVVASHIMQQYCTTTVDSGGRKPTYSKGTTKNDAKSPAPLHKLSLKGQNPHAMSLAEKFDALGNVLRHIDMDLAPPVSTLSNAMQSCKLKLKLNYLEDEEDRVDGWRVFTGCLKIHSQFIARGIGTKKKDVKQEVYKKSIDLLRQRPGSQIVKLRDPGPGQPRQEFEKHIQANAIRNVGAMDVRESLVEPVANSNNFRPLKELVTKVKAMKVSSETECISHIENAIAQTTPRRNHKYLVKEHRIDNAKPYYSGQLRIGPFVIGRGQGLSKKTCKRDSYMNSWHHLRTKSLGDLTASIPEEKKHPLHIRKQPHMQLQATHRVYSKQPVQAQMQQPLNHQEHIQPNLVNEIEHEYQELHHKWQPQQSTNRQVYQFSNKHTSENPGSLDTQTISQDIIATTEASMAQVCSSAVASSSNDNIAKGSVEHVQPIPADIASIVVKYTPDKTVAGGTNFPEPELSDDMTKGSSEGLKTQEKTTTTADVSLKTTSTSSLAEHSPVQIIPFARPLAAYIPLSLNKEVAVASEKQLINGTPAVQALAPQMTGTLAIPTTVNQIVYTSGVETEVLTISSKSTTEANATTSVVSTTSKANYLIADAGTTMTAITTNEVANTPTSYTPPKVPPFSDALKVSRAPTKVTRIPALVPLITGSHAVSTNVLRRPDTSSVTIKCPVIVATEILENTVTTTILSTVPTLSGTPRVATTSKTVTDIPAVGTKDPAITSIPVKTSITTLGEAISTLSISSTTTVATKASAISDKFTVTTTVPYVTDAPVIATTGPLTVCVSTVESSLTQIAGISKTATTGHPTTIPPLITTTATANLFTSNITTSVPTRLTDTTITEQMAVGNTAKPTTEVTPTCMTEKPLQLVCPQKAKHVSCPVTTLSSPLHKSMQLGSPDQRLTQQPIQPQSPVQQLPQHHLQPQSSVKQLTQQPMKTGSVGKQLNQQPMQPQSPGRKLTQQQKQPGLPDQQLTEQPIQHQSSVQQLIQQQIQPKSPIQQLFQQPMQTQSSHGQHPIQPHSPAQELINQSKQSGSPARQLIQQMNQPGSPDQQLPQQPKQPHSSAQQFIQQPMQHQSPTHQLFRQPILPQSQCQQLMLQPMQQPSPSQLLYRQQLYTQPNYLLQPQRLPQPTQFSQQLYQRPLHPQQCYHHFLPQNKPQQNSPK